MDALQPACARAGDPALLQHRGRGRRQVHGQARRRRRCRTAGKRRDARGRAFDDGGTASGNRFAHRRHGRERRPRCRSRQSSAATSPARRCTPTWSCSPTRRTPLDQASVTLEVASAADPASVVERVPLELRCRRRALRFRIASGRVNIAELRQATTSRAAVVAVGLDAVGEVRRPFRIVRATEVKQ